MWILGNGEITNVDMDSTIGFFLVCPRFGKNLLVSFCRSRVGGFGSNSYMYKINGTANINVIRAGAEKGVKRFVYISAADFGVVNYLLQGYYGGKQAAETELPTKFPYGATDPVLPPGIIDVYGILHYSQQKST
ncbi:Uncharacterized protein LOK49_LG05G01727 [Camellia lanceoleosa]|uniref:Uncharacterized protein n=1 Tax=Camellia lanceoleosa TaxID=1840588 RepID=A0ACC0HJ79_9ERIC|nr:Uncharacterized protein LOK49_LG05G01727 [Camellia lanceoleosa]